MRDVGGRGAQAAAGVLADAIQQAQSVKSRDVTTEPRRLSGSAPVAGSMRGGDQGEQRYVAVGVYDLGRDGWNLRIRSDTW